MSDVRFYHVTQMAPEKAAGKLLEKILSTGRRVHVYCANQERVDHVNQALWTYHPTSFLPHGTAKDGRPQDQLIWIASDLNVCNGATTLLCLDPIEIQDLSLFDMCLDLFSEDEAHTIALARNRWKVYKEAGHSITYWKQDPGGTWTNLTENRAT
jgi:DNA polymerase-3 subunit chi